MTTCKQQISGCIESSWADLNTYSSEAHVQRILDLKMKQATNATIYYELTAESTWIQEYVSSIV